MLPAIKEAAHWADALAKAASASAVKKVIKAIEPSDVYGAWYHPKSDSVRLSLGDWAESPSQEIHSALQAAAGGKVEVESEIGPPIGAGWLKLAANS